MRDAAVHPAIGVAAAALRALGLNRLSTGEPLAGAVSPQGSGANAAHGSPPIRQRLRGVLRVLRSRRLVVRSLPGPVVAAAGLGVCMGAGTGHRSAPTIADSSAVLLNVRALHHASKSERR